MWLVMAQLGVARCGTAGMARLGREGWGAVWQVRQGMVMHGMVGPGLIRYGRYGSSGLGSARLDPGTVWQAGQVSVRCVMV